MELADLQCLLYRLITAPNGVEEGLVNEGALAQGGLDKLVRGDDRLSARQRLAIYANAYFYRLLDVLREDFPATLATLGDTQFHNLITGYLIEYPPTEPSIQYAGRHLAVFLANHLTLEPRPFLADLARLERTLVEVFHAADAVALEAAALAGLGPAEWPALSLKLHPAARILNLDWHTELVVRTVEAGEALPAAPAPGPLQLLVWRYRGEAQYRELESGEAAGLTLAAEGASFAAICETVAAASGTDDPAALITAMLGKWLSAGLLLRCEP